MTKKVDCFQQICFFVLCRCRQLDYLPISNGNENAKKKGKLKVYFLNIIEDQYETAIHLVVMIVIIVQIKTDAQKNYTKK